MLVAMTHTQTHKQQGEQTLHMVISNSKETAGVRQGKQQYPVQYSIIETTILKSTNSIKAVLNIKKKFQT